MSYEPKEMRVTVFQKSWKQIIIIIVILNLKKYFSIAVTKILVNIFLFSIKLIL